MNSEPKQNDGGKYPTFLISIPNKRQLDEHNDIEIFVRFIVKAIFVIVLGAMCGFVLMIYAVVVLLYEIITYLNK